MRRLLGLCALCALGACAVGPTFHRPAPPTVGAYTRAALPRSTAEAPVAGGTSQTLVAGMDLPGDWWTLFRSEPLTALVREAIARNADLAAAEAALRVADETYLAERGALYPQVGADFNVSRQKASGSLSPPLSTTQELFTLHTLSLTVSYVPDVFGGLRRQVEATRAQAEAQAFETRAAYLTLTANLVSDVVQAASLADQVAATRRTIAIAEDVLATVRRQKAAGEAAGLDVVAEQSALAQAEQALPPLERQLAAERDLIADLTGRFPSEADPPAVALADLTLPAALPVTLPSRLVEQRPDIRAAEANLHAANAEVGVAIANRLPNFTLTAEGGGISTALATLLSGPNGFYTLTGDVTQPIFQGGTLLHRQRAAEAARDETRAQYRSTVLAAFQNVADVLQAIDADSRGLAAAVRAEAAADATLAITRRQLAAGQVAGLNVLLAEQAEQQAVIARVQAQASRYADTVALYQALGGGWWTK